MSWQRWDFRFLDTCFFREAVPFNAGEGGYSSVEGTFPPYITTLQGAVRTSLAAERGWSPGGKEADWPQELGGPGDTGVLSFRGPYLFGEGKPYYPAPLMLIKVKEGFSRLIPGEAVECDLGKVRLPRPKDAGVEGIKTLEGYFINKESLEKVLSGGVPSEKDVVSLDYFCEKEPRVGIELENETRKAKEGQLYNIVHTRPKKYTSVSVYVGGIPSEWRPAQRRIVPVGGEARLADVEVNESAPNSIIPSMPSIKPEKDGKVRFTVTLITPGWYGEDAEKIKEVIKNGPPGVPGQCVSACIGKAVYIGGWDMANCEPRPLVAALPPGSLWFFEAEEKDLERLKELHGSCISPRDNCGFGQVIIGKWGDF
ncbi:MAG: type III-B CRISPR module-associated protein Cmr3 [Clostridia bacterium]|nr:type III-B CRISPR module-associated protein Cmr3 [Clostridia bacterium]